jgi:hypothetical protein
VSCKNSISWQVAAGKLIDQGIFTIEAPAPMPMACGVVPGEGHEIFGRSLSNRWDGSNQSSAAHARTGINNKQNDDKGSLESVPQGQIKPTENSSQAVGLRAISIDLSPFVKPILPSQSQKIVKDFISELRTLLANYNKKSVYLLPYSTVTDLARFRGWSTSQPRRTAR